MKDGAGVADDNDNLLMKCIYIVQKSLVDARSEEMLTINVMWHVPDGVMDLDMDACWGRVSAWVVVDWCLRSLGFKVLQ